MIGSFDRIGFQRHRRAFRSADLDVDLAGRCCLITGGNAGLGRATAEALAQRGATVHLLCRDAGRGEAARDELRRATGNARVEAAVVDVSDLGAVRRYAARASLERVDVLVHNAGVLPAGRVLTADGLELTLATHVIGPHLLTHLLAAPLRAAGDARVVFVSSGGMYTQRLELDDLSWERRPYDGVIAYAQTKRMQVVLAAKWSQFLGAGVSVYSMHPGWADTSGVKTSLPRFYQLTRRILRTPAEGADTIVWLAARRPAPAPSGGFWFDRTPRTTHYLPWTREDQPARDRLWATCQRLAGCAGNGRS
jgi:NAD(P)-dependent dehydrogenase (short-subunit alcohol dehydrogenase family)